jgi:prevent-host-death family protein
MRALVCPLNVSFFGEGCMKGMVNVHAAKTNFSKLLARVAQGEEIVIAKDGVPVAKLIPFASGAAPRVLGAFAGEVWIAEDAFETPAWLIDAFEGVDAHLPPPAKSRSDRAAPKVAERKRPKRGA